MGVIKGGEHVIYAIRNKRNGKVYIGRTQDLEKRVKQHWSEKFRTIQWSNKKDWRGKLSAFEQDLKDMGKNAFEVYCIEKDVPADVIREREAHWISEYNSADPRFGYNRSRGEAREHVTWTDGAPPNLYKGG